MARFCETITLTPVSYPEIVGERSTLTVDSTYILVPNRSDLFFFVVGDSGFVGEDDRSCSNDSCYYAGSPSVRGVKYIGFGLGWGSLQRTNRGLIGEETGIINLGAPGWGKGGALLPR